MRASATYLPLENPQLREKSSTPEGVWGRGRGGFGEPFARGDLGEAAAPRRAASSAAVGGSASPRRHESPRRSQSLGSIARMVGEHEHTTVVRMGSSRASSRTYRRDPRVWGR